MITLDCVPPVKIDLDPGVYVFERLAGSGKTYLARTLDLCRAAGAPVASFTYSDVVKGQSLSQFTDMPFDVLMLDRYDLYQSDILNEIADKHPDSIILIAANNDLMCGIYYDVCSITFNRNGLTVY